MSIVKENRIVERWGIFELTLGGPSEGNPFLDVSVTAKFTKGEKETVVTGFYDGGGRYIARFMPDETGIWTYETLSNVDCLNKVKGEFKCTEPSQENHGPVKVYNEHHFCYSDDTPYFPFGTTCYAWTHQGDELEMQTIETLKNAPFNKIRMCVFPKNYDKNVNDPQYFPFEGTAPKGWDFTRFNPEFFRHLEERLKALLEMGIEADLILFHPYDKGRWGFDNMGEKTDEFYLKYIVARLSSFRNIWWSMANEYDYMLEKTGDDWEKLFLTLVAADPYGRLRSIHNGDILYDHWKDYVTHASIQIGSSIEKYRLLRDAYKKPVIYDEVGYEGNLTQRWGCLKAEELVQKFWLAIVSGTYMTHGETFNHPQEIIWWAKGGRLYGQSPERIAFLRRILEESHIEGLDFIDKWWILNAAGVKGDFYLYYFGTEKPKEWVFELPAMGTEIPAGTKFQVDVIDTWNMTITPVKELFEITDRGRYTYVCSYNPKVELPGREYMALRITKAN